MLIGSLSLALVGALIAVGVATALGSRKAAGSRLAQFREYGLSFRYPASWRTLDCKQIPTTISDTIVFLTSASPPPACTKYGWPHERLGKDGVIVAWWDFGAPGWDSIRKLPGREIVVGGQPARIAIQPPSEGSFEGPCAKLGADRTVNVAIRRPGVPANWYMLTACLRGPDLHSRQAQIRAMLASAKLQPPRTKPSQGANQSTHRSSSAG